MLAFRLHLRCELVGNVYPQLHWLQTPAAFRWNVPAMDFALLSLTQKRPKLLSDPPRPADGS